MSNFFCKYQSPLDEITIASNGSAITGLWFAKQKHFDAELGENNANSDLPIFTKAMRWLDAYFAGENPGEIPPIQLDGTPFQLEVWRILQTIPYGERTTYGEIEKYRQETRYRQNVSTSRRRSSRAQSNFNFRTVPSGCRQ